MNTRPKILSPAGSYEALEAAVLAGADEVYFGYGSFNARQNAKNFTEEEAHRAFEVCRLHKVSTNVTLNTLVTDREMKDACRIAYDALCHGADAFIVQDMGLASALKKLFPEIVLHASTQCACHSRSGAVQLAKAGFDRIVLAREMGREDIESVVKTGIETEIFVHGALCVCHSGMCLMSSVIGKRSGNRGLCAQPCRLPYEISGKGKARDKYPLSLKDLSLAYHVKELSEMGVTSLKIEGRMKSPEYVSGVTGIWKRIVEENRNATDEEYGELVSLFSRSGFTDGYFTGEYRENNSGMYGVRTEKDKLETKLKEDSEEKTLLALPRLPIEVECGVSQGKAPVLTLSCGGVSETVEADFIAEQAKSKPMTREDIENSLAKFGGTDFECTGIHVDLEGDVFLPKSLLNSLRRRAAERLRERLLCIRVPEEPDYSVLDGVFGRREKKCAEPTYRIYARTEEEYREKKKRFKDEEIESVCLSLELFRDGEPDIVKEIAASGVRYGVKLPRVIFTEEEDFAFGLLTTAKESGAVYGEAGNIGHIELIRRAGLEVYGGAGLNVFNSQAARFFEDIGLRSVTYSPELSAAQMRDMAGTDGMSVAVAASGRLEIMVLESCIIAANSHCRREKCGCSETIVDRVGAVFPIVGERRMTFLGYPCRNIILNSVGIGLLGKPDEVRKTGADVLCIL